MAKRAAGSMDGAVSAGGVALLTSILGNIQQAGANEALERSVEALQRSVLDWQQAHASLKAQLALALHANEQHTLLLA